MLERNDKVVKIPITYNQRKINELGDGYVPCQISERWLQFPEYTSDARFIFVDLMTIGADEEPKKICNLVLNKEDILRAINSVKVEELDK